ncbi:hypothetical protein OG558_27485 [Kribbella sp. NBC_01510]|uniref:hypothetical protein n=1 Tax=Kribbella sp. NBC_01510 TaxID=2903581 RepID=UPI003864DECE
MPVVTRYPQGAVQGGETAGGGNVQQQQAGGDILERCASWAGRVVPERVQVDRDSDRGGADGGELDTPGVVGSRRAGRRTSTLS